MNNIKTRIHFYSFNIKNADEKEEYTNLKFQLESVSGLKCFTAWGGDSFYKNHAISGKEIELETKHLFQNQWNTAPIDGVSDKGLRVFDWAEDYQLDNKSIKRGHYLEQTLEMKSIRDNTYVCGYCGKNRFKPSMTFCDSCLDSEYLTEKDLILLRLHPVSVDGVYPELTDDEKSFIMPLYIHFQTVSESSRAVKKRNNEYERIEKEYNKQKLNADIEYQGKKWLLDKSIPLDNIIFYHHTMTFCLGWRTPISTTLKPEWMNRLNGFPYTMNIKEA